MDTLTQIILTQINDRDTAELLALIFIAVAAFCIIFGALLLLNTVLDPVRSRFERGKNNVVLPAADRDAGLNVYYKYQHILLPTDEELIGRTMQRLHHAGFHYRKQMYQYYAIRLMLTFGLPLVAIIFMLLLPGIKLATFFQVSILMLGLGYIGPSFTLDHLIKKRQKTIQRAFPDALDLLIVCSEAGLSLDAAIQKVTAEIKISQPVLAEEFNLVIAEIRAGIDRRKAFNNLSERTGVEDIRGLMSTINQSIRFGSSIAETLRVYSEDFRDKRMQAAEEKAAKIGAKLIFPTALCLLPCFIMIVMVPFALNLLQVFKNLH